MLLETLENGKDDIIVYSRNILNNDENFRMIFKNDPGRVQRKLFLYDLCGMLNSPVPKNVILYRLLTNFNDLSFKSTECGCLLNINNRPELFYPDPIYAVNELEKVSEDHYLPNLRFRIQQVGLSTTFVEGENIQFNELFYFDLDALEAQAQNDSVFLPALLLYKKIDKKGILENLSNDSRFELLNNLEDDDSEEEPSLNKLAAVHLSKGSKNGNKAASNIEIFNSPKSLSHYIRQKIGKRKILRLK